MPLTPVYSDKRLSISAGVCVKPFLSCRNVSVIEPAVLTDLISDLRTPELSWANQTYQE